MTSVLELTFLGPFLKSWAGGLGAGPGVEKALFWHPSRPLTSMTLQIMESILGGVGGQA